MAKLIVYILKRLSKRSILIQHGTLLVMNQMI